MPDQSGLTISVSGCTGAGHRLRRDAVPGWVARRDAGGGQGAAAVHYRG